MRNALVEVSVFTESGITTLIELIMHCLNNVFLEFQNKFYVQDKGVVTGENNSVAIANITLHYLIKNIPEINFFTLKFKRYIDDILFITNSKIEQNIIINALTKKFNQYKLELTFKSLDTRDMDGEIEFLDVLHVANSSSQWGFKTRNFIKPTAKDAVFLNGKSHHPLYIFRGIILSEAKRMRRLNETNDDYFT